MFNPLFVGNNHLFMMFKHLFAGIQKFQIDKILFKIIVSKYSKRGLVLKILS
jgi:hypothetical protein